jgi:predicted HTH transcriptional regulator
MLNGLKDEFAEFFGEPTLVTLRKVLEKTTGELENLDFKLKWPDSPKLARHLLAMGNSGGGCIIVGISQPKGEILDPIGLDEFEDESTIRSRINKYIPNQIADHIHVRDFAYTESEYPKIKGKVCV